MAGVKALLKQAQKAQQKMEKVQAELAVRELTYTGGGGAVTVKVTGMREFKAIALDPEFLKEDRETIEATLLDTIKGAQALANKTYEDEMQKVTASMQMPGLV